MIEVGRYLPLYLLEARRRLGEARRALEEGERGTLKRSFHTLRGMSLTLGFSEIAEGAGELEERAEIGEGEEMERGIQDLEEAVLLLAQQYGED